MVSKTPHLDEVLSEDVLKFAQEHRLVDHVEKAVLAAKEVFADAERIVVSMKRDPNIRRQKRPHLPVHSEYFSASVSGSS
jgi:hypothetical protein